MMPSSTKLSSHFFSDVVTEREIGIPSGYLHEDGNAYTHFLLIGRSRDVNTLVEAQVFVFKKTRRYASGNVPSDVLAEIEKTLEKPLARLGTVECHVQCKYQQDGEKYNFRTFMPRFPLLRRKKQRDGKLVYVPLILVATDGGSLKRPRELLSFQSKRGKRRDPLDFTFR